MPSDRRELIERIKAVEREHQALRFATDHALDSIRDGTIDLRKGLGRFEIDIASKRLEGTYIVRLFSEFELAVNSALSKQKVKKIPRTAKAMINRLAARVKVAAPILDKVHEVRKYRNRLVHEREDAIPMIERMRIRKVTSHLCTFLSFSVV